VVPDLLKTKTPKERIVMRSTDKSVLVKSKRGTYYRKPRLKKYNMELDLLHQEALSELYKHERKHNQHASHNDVIKRAIRCLYEQEFKNGNIQGNVSANLFEFADLKDKARAALSSILNGAEQGYDEQTLKLMKMLVSQVSEKPDQPVEQHKPNPPQF